MKNILITGIGGLTPRSIARHIRKKYTSYKIIGIDVNPKALGFFIPGLIDKGYIAPRMSSPMYWDFIKQITKKEKIDFAFVQPEVEIVGWGEYFKLNGAYPCPVLIPPVSLSKTLMDKAIMADVLNSTKFIPQTIKVTQDNPKFKEIETTIGFPCWIRATKGSGGLGSLKLKDISSYKSWLFINNEIDEFTVSEYLPGRHLATQMLYLEGEYIKGASLECAEYVMADIVPSKVTGNTSFGRFLNENSILDFCIECMNYICRKLGVKPHGVLSFDLKEDIDGNLKITEVNIRHMAYTGVMASVGFDLITDSIEYLINRDLININRDKFYKYNESFIFLRDVDIEPIILKNEAELYQGYDE